jgi:surface antigen Omp85-like protein
VRSAGASLLVSLLSGLVAAVPAAAAEEPPVIREIVLQGVTAFERPAVLKGARLKEGQRLRRDPEEIAASIRAFYDGHCYMAVLATASFDPAQGRLTLTVDEGRLAEVVIEGAEGAAAEQARELLDLPPGRPLREKDLRAALERLERESGGAFRTGREGRGYVVERTADGVRLKLQVESSPARLVVRPKGPDLAPFYNRVEGFAPGLALDATVFDRTSFHHTNLYGRLSYGFASEAARYAVGIRRPFGGGEGLVLGYEYHDLTDTDDVFRRDTVEEPRRGRSWHFSILEDYYRRRGHEAYAFVRLSPRVHLGLTGRLDDFESLPVEAVDRLFLIAREARPNPAVTDGRLRSLVLTGRWAAREALYADSASERDSYLVRNPFGGPYEGTQGARLDTTLEVASGDASFQRGIVHLRGSRELSPRVALDMRGLAGFTSGDPPLQRRFALGGAGTLRGYAYKEFPGDHLALGTVEITYRSLSRYPTVRAFYDGGVAWGGEPGSGYRDDAGVGLEWPGGGRGYLRADLAFALRPSPGQDRARLHALVRVPF